MNEGHFHKIWQQQYEAAETIKLRYGALVHVWTAPWMQELK